MGLTCCWRVAAIALLLAGGVGPLTSPASGQLTPPEVEQVLAASVLFFIGEEYDGDTSELKLGRIWVVPGALEAEIDSLALTRGVSEFTGLPILDRDQGLACDASGYSPRWRWRDSGSPVAAGLVSVRPGEAEVAMSYASFGRSVLVRRIEASWVVGWKDDQIIHGTPGICRPPPPEELREAEQVAFLEAAIMHVMEVRGAVLPTSICTGPWNDWLAGVEAPMTEALSERGLTLDCGSEAFEWSVAIGHIVFHDDPNRVLVQLLATERAGVERAREENATTPGPRPPSTHQCEIRREVGVWRVDACEMVHWSRAYPRVG